MPERSIGPSEAAWFDFAHHPEPVEGLRSELVVALPPLEKERGEPCPLLLATSVKRPGQLFSTSNLWTSPRTRGAGFTLIEILLVVAILGVIAGLSLPDFQKTYERIELSQAANNIAYLMRYAQSRSIIQRRNLQFICDSDGKRYWLTQEARLPIEEKGGGQARLPIEEKMGGQGSRVSFEKLSGRWGRIFKIPREISVQAEDSSVSFSPDGKITRTEISLCRQSRCVVVSTKEQIGYVYVFESSGMEESPKQE